MSTKSQLEALEAIDQDAVISYAAFIAGTGPVASIMRDIESLEPAERVLVRDLFDRTYRKDGHHDRRRATARNGAEPPFDPPYVDDDVMSAEVQQ